MSGGSYNYLCYRDPFDFFQWGAHDEELDHMIKRLEGLNAPKALAAANALKAHRNLINEMIAEGFAAEFNAIKGIFKAVEWRDSGDIGEERLREALDKYEQEGVCLEMESAKAKLLASLPSEPEGSEVAADEHV